MKDGQITAYTPLGKAIIKLARLPHLRTFVDDGAWLGGGSMGCLVAGIASVPRHDVEIIAIEANKKIFDHCCKTWSAKPPYLKIVWGTLTKKMMSESEIRNHPKFDAIKSHFDLYYAQDIEDLFIAPLVTLPRYIDVFVLDAGEWTGDGSLDVALSARPRFIALSSIYTMKHANSFDRLLFSGEWSIWASGTDRNGWVIFERKSSGSDDAQAWGRYTNLGL